MTGDHLDEIRCVAAAIRRARDNPIEFAATYRQRAEDREARARDLTAQLDELECRIAATEVGT